MLHKHKNVWRSKNTHMYARLGIYISFNVQNTELWATNNVIKDAFSLQTIPGLWECTLSKLQVNGNEAEESVILQGDTSREIFNL